MQLKRITPSCITLMSHKFEKSVFIPATLLSQGRIMILCIESPLELPSTLRFPSVIRLRRAANAHVRAREVLQHRYICTVVRRWTAFHRHWDSCEMYTQAVPFAITPQHRAPQHEPQNRSRSLRALRTPVVTASRQARDNEIQYIFSTSTCKDTEQQRQQHTPRDRKYIHIRRKIYICTNNGWAWNGHNRQLHLAQRKYARHNQIITIHIRLGSWISLHRYTYYYYYNYNYNNNHIETTVIRQRRFTLRFHRINILMHQDAV